MGPWKCRTLGSLIINRLSLVHIFPSLFESAAQTLMPEEFDHHSGVCGWGGGEGVGVLMYVVYLKKPF